MPDFLFASLPPHFGKRQGFPQHAHQGHALVLVQMHQFLIQSIQNQDGSLLGALGPSVARSAPGNVSGDDRVSTKTAQRHCNPSARDYISIS